MDDQITAQATIVAAQKVAADAKNAAEVAQTAVTVAEALLKKAQETAKDFLVKADHQRMLDSANSIVKEHEGSDRFIDISRIPLICQSIVTIGTNLNELKDMMKDLPNQFVSRERFKPVEIIAYGFCGLILTGFVGALIALVFRS